MIKKETIKELVELYLTGEITPVQKSALLEMLDNPDYSDEINAIFRDNYSQIETPELDEAVTAAFIAKLKSKAELQVTIEESIPVKSIFNWKKLAVAASILLIASIGVYYATLSVKITKSNTATKISPKRTNLTPGKEGAILTLANGEQIVLDSAANGLLANQQNTTVIKKDGQLVYAQGNTTEVVYNTMSTPRGRNYNLHLSDGTKVWLNAASSITFPTAFTGQKRSVEITGEVFFEVAKDATKSFSVNVKDVEIQVFGTHFNVMAYEDEAKIATTLVEGSVSINKNGTKHLLQPGQMGVIDKSGKFNLDTDADIESITAWKNGKFHFYNADIKTIMRQLSRWYDADVNYEGAVFEEKLSGIISRKEDVRVLLKSFEKAGGLKFKVDGRKIIVTE